jgi:N utilization substance protein A
LRVEVDEDEAFAKVYILPSERARAVGKGWLNVTLASKLTGYKISIEDVQEEWEKIVKEEEVWETVENQS